MRWATVAIGLVFTLGCGGPQSTQTPDDEMTAEEHEDEAAVLTTGADTADELAHAEEHRRQAEALREFEDESCHGMDESARGSCPLLLNLEEVTPIEGGVRLAFAADADLGPLYTQLRCHLAYAAAQGREGIDHCALYVPGTEMQTEENLVLLTTDQPEHVEELRRRVAVQAP